MIAASELHELFSMIYDILDSAVVKWVGNMTHILTNLFTSASRQCFEVCALQFAFLYNIEDSISPTEACLYGYINWSLGKVDQQLSLLLSQSSTSMMGVRTKKKAGFLFNVQKQPMQDSGYAFLVKKLQFDTKHDGH